MLNVELLTRRFANFFNPQQSTVLAQTIHDAYTDLVKTDDFNELKAIVARLAVAQERTEIKMSALAVAQERTETKVAELAEAQQRTEARLDHLAQTVDGLATTVDGLGKRMDSLTTTVDTLGKTVNGLAQEMGGLSRTMSYALENEAYRNLPALLAAQYGITLDKKLVRTDVDGEEINLFAHGTRNDKAIYLVGESKSQLDERRGNQRAADDILRQLARKAAIVQKKYPESEIVQLLITHYARPGFLQKAEKAGVIIIQSFEW
jgi:uncharacterized protein YoxC